MSSHMHPWSTDVIELCRHLTRSVQLRLGGFASAEYGNDRVNSCKIGALQATPCYVDRGSQIGVICAIVSAGVYFVVIWGLLYYKLKWYKKMPYVAVNKGIIYTTLQVCCFWPWWLHELH